MSATASLGGSAVPGSFAYDPPAGTILPVGTHLLGALFTPTDPSSVTIARGVATLTVNKAATTLTAYKLLSNLLRPTVRLTRSDHGTPLAGEWIDISDQFRPLCRAKTDANGVARCPLRVAAGYLGFHATFSETSNYLGPSADGRLR